MPNTTAPKRPAPVGVRLPVPEAWAGPIAEFDAHCAGMTGRPRSTRKTFVSNLQHAARRLEGGPWDQDVKTLRAYFVANPEWSQETRRQRRYTLASFYDWAMEQGYMERNPARQLPKVKASAERPRPAPEAIYQQALVAAKPREKLMLRMSYELGMRRDEVARSASTDLWQDYDGGWVLDVHGKGGKTRTLPVPDGLARVLQDLPAGYWFPGGRDGHLSAEYVGRQLALLMPGDFTMHTLRHAYATRLYKQSGDILVVQDALGHASPDTTRRYIASDNLGRLRGFMESMASPHRLANQG